MPRTTRDLYNSLRTAGLSQATFSRLYKPVNTSEGVSVTPPLFATAEEITKVSHPIDYKVGLKDSPEAVWKEKDTQNRNLAKEPNTSYSGGAGTGAGVLPSLKEKGWDWNHRVPIGMQGARSQRNPDDPRGWRFESNTPVMVNAQHRVAAQLRLNKNQFIPLVHEEGEGHVFADTRVNKPKRAIKPDPLGMLDL
jgi:hypothetical protein